MRAVPLLLAAIACGDATAPSGSPRILYVGNSLTYTNNLPDIVAALAKADGQATPTYKSVTYGGYSLEDHWNEGTAAATIKSAGWDFVLLQQGPSSLDDSRVLLIDYAQRFTSLIHSAGGQPALFSVWPEVERIDVFAQVNANYAAAATAVSGVLLPAGEAWQAAWRRDATLGLYGPDGFHPSVLGSYLAALVIYQRIYGRTPVGLPAHLNVGASDLPVIDIFPPTAALLQAAAAEANAAVGKPAGN